MSNQKLASWLVGGLLLGGLIFIFIKGVSLLGFEGQPINEEKFLFSDLEIKGDFTVGQTFLAPRDDLQQIDVVLRNYGRRNTHEVTFYLKQAPDSPEVLYQETFNAAEISRSSQWRTFAFPPIPNSAGKSFFFYFASPDSVEGNAITVGGGLGDFYRKGSAHLRFVSSRGDLAFRTYYGLSPQEKLSILGQRLVEDKPSIWGDTRFYLLLLALYALILLRVFVKLFQLALSEDEH